MTTQLAARPRARATAKKLPSAPSSSSAASVPSASPALSSPTAALHALLDDGARFAPQDADGLSNHLPMALDALHALGASALRLQTFAAAQVPRLQPVPAPEPWPAGDAWAPALGQAGAWPRYRWLFRSWLLHEGAQDVLNQVLPRLLAGSGAAAFHGLLRTAHAVHAGHAGEIADGLATWAAAWTPLGAALDPLLGTVVGTAVGTAVGTVRGKVLGSARAPSGDDADLLHVLRRLQGAVPGPLPAADLIVTRMQAVSAMPGFDAAVQRLALPTLADAGPDLKAAQATADALLQPLARTAAALYAQHGNFTVLHLVTATLALRRLLPFVDDRGLALRGAWRAWAAAFLASGVPLPRPTQGAIAGASPGDDVQAPAWRSLLPRARASDDAHVVKLAAACREAEGLWGGSVWRAAVARVLQG